MNSASCPTCGSPDRFCLRSECGSDQYDPDPWHRRTDENGDENDG